KHFSANAPQRELLLTAPTARGKALKHGLCRAESEDSFSIYLLFSLASSSFANGEYCEHASALSCHLFGCSLKIESSNTLERHWSARQITRASILRFANSISTGGDRCRQLAQDFGSLGINKKPARFMRRFAVQTERAWNMAVPCFRFTDSVVFSRYGGREVLG